MRRGSRLDRFLAGELEVVAVGAPALDRGREGDGRRAPCAKPRARVREGERVAVEPMAPATTEAKPEEGVAFEVLHVDDDVVVVNKPPGLVVHPARGHAGGTLVNGCSRAGSSPRGEDDERASGDRAPPRQGDERRDGRGADAGGAREAQGAVPGALDRAGVQRDRRRRGDARPRTTRSTAATRATACASRRACALASAR